jgi:O-antigen/teichoic acid export membrane protein
MTDGNTAVKDPIQWSFDRRHLAADLKVRSVRGGAATILGQAARFVINSGATIVLARLLSPEDFGLVGMIAAFTGLAPLLTEMGLSMATVQKAEITHEQINTLFWANVAFSAVGGVATLACAPVLAWFYGEPRLIALTIGTALCILFGGLSVQHGALMQRQMRFTALAVNGAVGLAGGVVVAIIAAILGAHYWAIILQNLFVCVYSVISVWFLCPWRPGLPSICKDARAMLTFGGNLTGFNIINYFARNTDSILIGRVWGPNDLGLYSKAYNLLLLPLRQVTMPLAAVAIPGLSSLQNQPERFRQYYLKSLSLAAFLAMPIGAVLLFEAGDFVRIVLGDQWTAAVRIFRYLAMAFFAQVLCNTSGWLYVSLGRTGELLRVGALGSFCMILSFVAGLPFGASGVALSYAVCMVLWVVPCMYFATRSTSILLSAVFVAVAPAFLSAMAGGAIVAVVSHPIGIATSSICCVLLRILLFGVLYLVVLYGFGRKHMHLGVLSVLAPGVSKRLKGIQAT